MSGFSSRALSPFQSTLPARGATANGIHVGDPSSRFQSTLPARGATIATLPQPYKQPNFNPRSPHGERRNLRRRCVRVEVDFNPRSPHGERRLIQHPERRPQRFQSTLPARGATRISCTRCGTTLFQSTLPARGATHSATSSRCFSQISIHAPRTGSDATLSRRFLLSEDFNPRSPHGERPEWKR